MECHFVRSIRKEQGTVKYKNTDETSRKG